LIMLIVVNMARSFVQLCSFISSCINNYSFVGRGTWTVYQDCKPVNSIETRCQRQVCVCYSVYEWQGFGLTLTGGFTRLGTCVICFKGGILERGREIWQHRSSLANIARFRENEWERGLCAWYEQSIVEATRERSWLLPTVLAYNLPVIISMTAYQSGRDLKSHRRNWSS
jgi:hypothetical protein